MTWNRRDSAATSALREEFGAWLRANLPEDGFASGDTAEGFEQVADWERSLYAAGWAMVDWPLEHGGRGLGTWDWLALESEYWRSGAPPKVSQNGATLLAPSLMRHGTPEQKERLLPRIARLDDVWCQGWSEPGAGSDLAALRSTATRTEGGWLLNGQKTWSTRGAFCSHLFGPFRSDPDSTRHRGLTYFLVPLEGETVQVRGFERFDGDLGFADVYFTDHFVSDEAVLGEPGRGWELAMSTTTSERGVSLRSPARYSVAADRLLAAARRHQDPARRRLAVEAWIEAQAYDNYTAHTLTRAEQGRGEPAESSVNKLMWSALDLRLQEAAVRQHPDRDAVPGDDWRAFQFSLAGPIYAGTNDIQRDIVAQRLLGLPRGRR